MNIRYRSSNKRNDYFEITEAKSTHPITVVHTEFDTFVCLSCRSHTCEHAKATEKSDAVQERVTSETVK